MAGAPLSVLFFVSLAALTLSGCGGGFAQSTTTTGANTPKTYVVTVTGVSGSETQTTTVQLTVE